MQTPTHLAPVIRRTTKRMFKNMVIVVANTLLLLALIEVTIRIAFDSSPGDISCIISTGDARGYTLRPNCSYQIKNWEADKAVEYETDKKGRRSRGKKDPTIHLPHYLAFFGDSFTFGAMSNYDDTYGATAVQEVNRRFASKLYRDLNYGVSGYDVAQVLATVIKVDSLPEEKPDLFIYGLTPNDLFDLEKIALNGPLRTEVAPTNSYANFPDFARMWIRKLDLRTPSVLAHYLFKNPLIYASIYRNRGDLAGYIRSEGSTYWDVRYQKLESVLRSLPPEIKNRLILTIVPQFVQTTLIRTGKVSDGLAFDRTIMAICERIKISCFSFTQSITNEFELTHYPVDGHLLPAVSHRYGELLGAELFQHLRK